jgi:hypothetical protein
MDSKTKREFLATNRGLLGEQLRAKLESYVSLTQTSSTAEEKRIGKQWLTEHELLDRFKDQEYVKGYMARAETFDDPVKGKTYMVKDYKEEITVVDREEELKSISAQSETMAKALSKNQRSVDSPPAKSARLGPGPAKKLPEKPAACMAQAKDRAVDLKVNCDALDALVEVVKKDDELAMVVPAVLLKRAELAVLAGRAELSEVNLFFAGDGVIESLDLKRLLLQNKAVEASLETLRFLAKQNKVDEQITEEQVTLDAAVRRRALERQHSSLTEALEGELERDGVQEAPSSAASSSGPAKAGAETGEAAASVPQA